MEKSLISCVSNNVIQGKCVNLDHSHKPYLVKIFNWAGFDVWLVDGEYIRKFISEDFINFDQHYHLNFIPKNEFWIDVANKHHEVKFYIDRLYIESRLMVAGKSYAEAYRIATIHDIRERAKLKIIKDIRKRKLPKEKLVKKVHKKLLINRKIKVWLVDGSLVRSLFFNDFAGGGHDKVYPFIPKNEIWIDDDITDKEKKFLILHEMHERTLMTLGSSYSEAHASATEVEDYCRHNPKKIERVLKAEVEKVTHPEKVKLVVGDFHPFIRLKKHKRLTRTYSKNRKKRAQ